MHKILIVSDSFKGTLSSLEVGEIIQNKVESELKNCPCKVLQISDGGEGIINSLKKPLSLEIHQTNITGPTGLETTAEYAFCKIKKIFVAEMALCSGLPQVPSNQRNPLHTNSVGTGQILLKAKELGAQKILLGVGGSATNDAGLGALKALGCIIDFNNNNVQIPKGEDLININKIKSPLNHWLTKIDFQIACDVNNPFTGPNGATYIYGPQKIADGFDKNKILSELEKGMLHFQKKTLKATNIKLNDLAGSGAAGGIAGSLAAFFNAKLVPGIDIIADAINLEEEIKKADIIISGEGQIDSQSINGKVISGVLALTQLHQKELWVVCGQNKLNPKHSHKIKEIFSLIDCNPLNICLHNSKSALQNLTSQKIIPALKKL